MPHITLAQRVRTLERRKLSNQKLIEELFEKIKNVQDKAQALRERLNNYVVTAWIAGIGLLM